jgi:hypothetical protein
VTFDERQRARRSQGQIGTAALLDRIEAANPLLREYAERLLAAKIPLPDPADTVGGRAAIRDAMRAVWTLNARREMAQIGAALRDAPEHPDAGRWRERLADLAKLVARLERAGPVRGRPWGSVLREEARP